MEELPNAPELARKLTETALRGFERPCTSGRGTPWGGVTRIEFDYDECPIPAVMGFALSLAGLERFGPGEKVAWWVSFVYDGSRFEVAHQKFGLRLRLASDSMSDQEAEARLLRAKKKLIAASKIVEKDINRVTGKLVDSGDATVLNQHRRLRTAYDYFRDRATNPAKVEDDRREYGGDGLGFSGSFFTSGAAAMQLNSTHDVVAAVTAYLSNLEHDLVLALPFAGFDPARDHLTRFIGMRWGLKYERVLGQKGQAKEYMNRLVAVVERWRNPYAHGGFEKGNGSTVYAHVPGAGALPVGLSSMRARPFFSLSNANDVAIRDVFEFFDEFDAWFARAAPQASAWMESGLSVRFDREFCSRVQSYTEDLEGFQTYMNCASWQDEQAANMDY